MSYEIGWTEPLDEWEWDGVLVGLDFTPQLECDVCDVYPHAAVYHVTMICGCVLFMCRETLLVIPYLMQRFRITCPECGHMSTYIRIGRPI